MSIELLYKLAKEGTIANASSVFAEFFNPLSWFGGSRGAIDPNEVEMSKFGIKISKKLLEIEKGNVDRAAAQLLLLALDGAYNAVLMCTSILDYFLVRGKGGTDSYWAKLQEAAFINDESFIRRYILEAERLHLRLPIIRKVAGVPQDPLLLEQFSEGDTIVIDIVAAQQNMPFFDGKAHLSSQFQATEIVPEDQYLHYASGFSHGNQVTDVREIHLLGLSSIIKVFAQMKNLRTAHDSQGRLKKVSVLQAYETYANYMAPMRVEAIHRKLHDKLQTLVDESEDKVHVKKAETAKELLAHKMTNPSSTTFLTPEWDEFIPFPQTWKIRFEGYGRGIYDKPDQSGLHNVLDLLWAPDGASYYGGSFATTEGCVCRQAGHKCTCAEPESGKPFEPVKSDPVHTGSSHSGCGM